MLTLRKIKSPYRRQLDVLWDIQEVTQEPSTCHFSTSIMNLYLILDPESKH